MICHWGVKYVDPGCFIFKWESQVRRLCLLHLKSLKSGLHWAYICRTVCLKSRLSSLFSSLFSPWLTPSLSTLQQMKEQSLNLLLSASHLDHKNSCSEHANQYPPILRTAAKDSQRWLFTKSRAERAQCYLIELPVAKLWAGTHNGRRLMTVQALTPCPRPFPEPHFRAAAAISQLLATDSLCHD